MNIKDKIIEWQGIVKEKTCCTVKEKKEIDGDLELILFVIDRLVEEV